MTHVIPAPVDLSVTRPEIAPWLVIVAATVFSWSDSRGCGQICPSFTVVAAVAAEVTLSRHQQNSSTNSPTLLPRTLLRIAHPHAFANFSEPARNGEVFCLLLDSGKKAHSEIRFALRIR